MFVLIFCSISSFCSLLKNCLIYSLAEWYVKSVVCVCKIRAPFLANVSAASFPVFLLILTVFNIHFMHFKNNIAMEREILGSIHGSDIGIFVFSSMVDYSMVFTEWMFMSSDFHTNSCL